MKHTLLTLHLRDWLYRVAWRIKLWRLAHSRQAIIVGPWRGEVGFEALYWIPFLRRAMVKGKINPDRLLIVTRGGLASVYDLFDADTTTVRAIDLYTLRSVDEVRAQGHKDRQETGLLKQTRVTDWDKAVIADAAKAAQLKRYQTLHPIWMYRVLTPWWANSGSLSQLIENVGLTLNRPLPVPPLPDAIKLPKKFVAVKFYARNTFPFNEDAVQVASQVVGTLASNLPVVLLNQPSVHADEHIDMHLTGPNIIHLPEVPPEKNLAVQAAVIGRAQAFIGTYGGVAQLALRMGRPSYSTYLNWGGTAVAHLGLSSMLSAMCGVPFVMLHAAEFARYWSPAVPNASADRVGTDAVRTARVDPGADSRGEVEPAQAGTPSGDQG